MTTAQFNAMLEQLAQMQEEAGDHDAAKALRNLRELFDPGAEQKLATLIKQIRVVKTPDLRAA
jgi:hypothetical protein